MNVTIKPDTVIKQKADIVYTYMDNEILLFNPNNGKYFSFNKTGAFIWEQIKKPISFNELINIVCTKYNIDPNICKTGIVNFLKQLYQKEMIELT